MGRHRLPDVLPFRVLFVCTGNICRSPFAEILARHLVTDRPGAAIEFRSAGVQAMVGAAIHPETRRLLGSPVTHDAIEGFAARQLRASMVHDSDLVLGATRQHRSVIVTQTPRAVAWTFTVREFARLVTLVDRSTLPTEPVQRGRVLVDQARRSRALQQPPRGADDDVPDPMGHPQLAHDDAAALIRTAVHTILDVLAPIRR